MTAMSYFTEMSLMPLWFWAAVAFFMGGAIASFLGVVGERVPRHETLGGRSHCVCGKELGASANLPVIGWVLCGGKAHCCSSRIPVRYVLAEASLAVGWALAVLVSPTPLIGAVVMAAMAGLVLRASWHTPEETSAGGQPDVGSGS